MTVTFPESELRDDEVDRQILLLLAAAYQQTSSTMSEAVAISTARAWLAMGGVSTADHERFKRWWRPTLRSASKQSASLSRRYVQSQAAIVAAGLVDFNVEIDRWIDDQIDVFLDSTLSKLTWHLSEGLAYDEAMLAAGNWAGDTSDTMLRAAEMQAASGNYPTFKTTGQQIMYTRVLQAGACGWCRVVADRMYSAESFNRARSGSWHTKCRCTWRMATASEAQQFQPNYNQGDWAHVIDRRFDPAAAAAEGYQSVRFDPSTGTNMVFNPATGNYDLAGA